MRIAFAALIAASLVTPALATAQDSAAADSVVEVQTKTKRGTTYSRAGKVYTVRSANGNWTTFDKSVEGQCSRSAAKSGPVEVFKNGSSGYTACMTRADLIEKQLVGSTVSTVPVAVAMAAIAATGFIVATSHDDKPISR